jgi:hypothetical protein
MFPTKVIPKPDKCLYILQFFFDSKNLFIFLHHPKDIEFNQKFADHIMLEVKKLLEIEIDFRIKVKEFAILQVNIVNKLIKY